MIKAEDRHKVDSKYEKIFDKVLCDAGFDNHTVHLSISRYDYSDDFKMGDVYPKCQT